MTIGLDGQASSSLHTTTINHGHRKESSRYNSREYSKETGYESMLKEDLQAAGMGQTPVEMGHPIHPVSGSSN